MPFCQKKMREKDGNHNFQFPIITFQSKEVIISEKISKFAF